MKTANLPQRRILSQADLFRLLSRQVAEDCMTAGWIAPRVTKPTGRKLKKLFALEDALECEQRILSGEYPEGSQYRTNKQDDERTE